MEHDNALGLLSLARKAGRIEVGEAPVGACARAGKARLILVAADAADNTLRRVQNLVAGTEQRWLRVPYDKDTLGGTVGRTAVAVCALTDPALALSFVRAMEPQPEDPDLIERLQTQAEQARRRQAEQKAHRANVRRGKKKS